MGLFFGNDDDDYDVKEVKCARCQKLTEEYFLLASHVICPDCQKGWDDLVMEAGKQYLNEEYNMLYDGILEELENLKEK